VPWPPRSLDLNPIDLKNAVYSVVVDTRELNVVAEWSTLLLRIQEVFCSNLGLETGYHD
jgi:hypothetical protein